MSHTELSQRLRQLAQGRADAEEIFKLADAFDAASVGFYSEPQTHSVQQFCEAWAHARAKLCAITGERLI